MRILFLVRGLNVGGAQRQLVALARGLHRRGHRVSVAVFYAGGLFEQELRAEGIPLHDLRKSGRWDTLGFLARVARLVRTERPDVLHAYMGANAFAALLKPVCPAVRIVWGVRTAKRSLRDYDWGARVDRMLSSLTAPLADAVVANSEAARRRVIELGVDERKVVAIPNGIDCERFSPDPEGRRQLRREWAVPDGAPLVGVIARLDPIKGHDTFLRAAARVAAVAEDVRFVFVGDGKASYREALASLAEELGLGARLIWAGERRVTRAVYSALDVAVLASNDGESWPNVVGEAMACGKPCVVTDTGDAELIVGDLGAVVPPRDPEALARRLLEVIEQARRDDGVAADRVRTRIAHDFSEEMLVTRTERTLERVLQA